MIKTLPVKKNSNMADLEKYTQVNTMPLGDSLLAVSKNGKWGIQDNNGKQVFSYLFDGMASCNDCIAVKKDNNVGLLDGQGGMIISPCYSSIECVKKNEKNYYCKENSFDSSQKNHFLVARIGNSKDPNDFMGFHWNNIAKMNIEGESLFDKQSVFILNTETFSELFSVEHGVYQNSRYLNIQQLTNKLFCVKQEDMFGVYDIDTESLIIECEYQRIIYEGKKVVKLQKNGLWGIRTIIKEDSQEIIDIPPSYLEINVLDEKECLFSAKTNGKYSCYILLNKEGEEILFDTPNTGFFEFGSHFKWFSNDLILVSVYNNVFGFVDSVGHISVPFKYNYVEKREDGNFDVNVCMNYEHKRYGETTMIPITFWGILDTNGKEIAPLKYTERIPSKHDFIIVKDSLSGFYGVLSPSEEEVIPCKYKRLIWSKQKDFLFFCHGGHTRGKDDAFLGWESNWESNSDVQYIKVNFFSDDIEYGKWGCIKKDGSIFVEAKYDCFKEVGEYITAGRDGSFLNDDNCYGEAYDGSYDLFDKNGDYIIGGFNEFKYDEINSLLMFRFGGIWKSEKDYIPDIYPPVSYVSNYFDDENSKWLIVSKDLKSIMRMPDGSRVQIKKGFYGSVRTIPRNLFSYKEPEINENLAVCESRKKKIVVQITDGIRSEEYDDVYVVGKNTFFYCNKEPKELGVRRIKGQGEDILLDASQKHIYAFTYPVNNYFFGFQKIDDKMDRVLLYSINDIQNPQIAISSIENKCLNDYIRSGYFIMKIDDGENNGLHSLMLQKNSLFDKTFIEKISPENTLPKVFWGNDIYIFSYNDYSKRRNNWDSHKMKAETNDNWREDAWDAMTDGMYGDMPDDFDGDFEFLG